MKKRLKILLSVLLIACMVIPASATDYSYQMESDVQPMYVATSSLQSGLSIEPDGKATCTGSVIASNVTYRTELTVELQQENGSSWSSIKSWEASGILTCTLSKAYYINAGTYRVCVTSKVYNSSGVLLETLTQYSREVAHKVG